MYKPVRSSSILLAIVVIAAALMASGCSNPLGRPPVPSVTVTAQYVPPSPTPEPLPTPTPVPTPVTTWDGLYVKLNGNVSASGGDRVYGTVKVFYLDQNYWDDHPTAEYDTKDGGAYSLEVRSNVSFKMQIGYYYFGRIPTELYVYKPDDIITLRSDGSKDFRIMTSNITPSY